MSRDLVVTDTSCCLMTSSSFHSRHIRWVARSHKWHQLVRRLKYKINSRLRKSQSIFNLQIGQKLTVRHDFKSNAIEIITSPEFKFTNANLFYFSSSDCLNGSARTTDDKEKTKFSCLDTQINNLIILNEITWDEIGFLPVTRWKSKDSKVSSRKLDGTSKI